MADDPPVGQRTRRLALGYGVVATGLALAWASDYDPWWIQPANLLTFWWSLPGLVLAPVAAVRGRPLVAVACLPAALVFLGAYGGLFLPGGGVADDDPLRVMAFNTYVLAPGADHVVQEVRAQDPDVVLLVEVFPQREEVLRDRLSDAYPWIETRSSDGVGGVMVLSRYPIVEAVDVGGATEGSRRTLAATVDVDGTPVQVVPVHLISPCLECGRSITARLDFEEEARRLEIGAVLRALDRRTPAIVGGDFNSTDRSGPYRRLVRAGFDDPHRAVGFGPGFTWPSDGVVPPFLRIDGILTRGLDAVGAHVGDSGASDHRPVVVDLSLRTP